MNSRKLGGILRLIRPLNVLIASLTVGAASVLGGAGSNSLELILLGMLTGALVSAGANAINDYFDYEIDKINRPERPIPRGDVTRADALAVWVGTSLGGISINIFLPFSALGIVAGSLVVLYWYSAYWKRTALAGNLVVALMTAMAFVYGGAVGGKLENTIIPALFAALINLAREIVKDIEDMEGDRQGKARTFPIRYGRRTAIAVATGVLAVLCIVLWIPVGAGIYGTLFAVLVLPVNAAVITVIVMLWKDSSRENLRRQSAVLKATMVMGLIAVVVGAF